MSVRVFKSIIPLSITDVLVAYDEDGVARNFIVQNNAELAGKVWAVRSQQAAVQKVHDDAILAAQAEHNTTVQAADEAYRAALAESQQKFVAAQDVAANAKDVALKPIQKAAQIVEAEAFSAANKLLPPTE